MPAAVQQAYDEVQRWRRERRGQRSSNFAEMGGLMHLSPQSPAPELQLMLVTALLDDHARQLHWGRWLSCHLVLLRPRSRGSVGLNGPSAQRAPRIDPNFLADEHDVQTLLYGFKRARALMQ
jgi:choline dehydrogenase-like flavoprotein